MLLPREEWTFGHQHIGRRVLVFDELPSTNDMAASLATDSTQAGIAVLADRQTSGRGQYGRVWQAPPGTSLLLSILLFPPQSFRRPVVLTALAAVAVSEAIRERTGLQVRVKWPNDLLLSGKKVCGILIEQAVGTVIGIGLNLNQSLSDFEQASLPDATSLAIAGGSVIESPSMLGLILKKLDEEYERLLSGDIVQLEADWKWRIGLLGRQVSIETLNGEVHTGRLQEMSFDGLEIERSTSEFSVIRPEFVRQLRSS